MKALSPELTAVKPIKVLTITSVGDPNNAQDFLEALYGTAYTTKFKVYKPLGKVMKMGPLIGRWPDAHLKAKSEWTGIWGLPVPDFVTDKDLLQKDPTHPVRVDTWCYKDVAQILHIGLYTEEGPTIKILHDFIAAQGYEIDGNSHEEVYLTSPRAKVQKTIIRYKIKKRKN